MTKKKLLTISVFLIVLGMLTAADALALNYNYTFSGKVTYVANGQAAVNTQVTIWVTWMREVGDYEPYEYYTVARTAYTNANGRYSFSFSMPMQWYPQRNGAEIWARPLPQYLGGNCKRYYYAYRSFTFAVGSNPRNIGMLYEDYCSNTGFDDEEVPDGLPSSWDHVFDKFSAGAGAAGNWENRLFGRFAL